MPAGFTTSQLRGRNAFYVDAANNQWIGFNTIGLGRFNGSSWTMFNSTNLPAPSSDTIFSITGNATSLWVGTSAGLSKFNGSTFTNFSSPFINDDVTALALYGNTVWVGTKTGMTIRR